MSRPQHEYVRELLDAYRNTPGTTGRVRPEDRHLAAQLYRRGVSLSAACNALALAAVRRGFRPFDAPPLQSIRSLRYILPILDEILHQPPPEDYFLYVHDKLEQLRRDPQLQDLKRRLQANPH